jgi:osmotically-inducible protein OsmY
MRQYQTAVHVKRNFLLGAMKEALRGSSRRPLWDQDAQVRGDDGARSDGQIRRDIIDELQSEPTIDATSIGVHVKDGVVTLVGRADGEGDKWLMEAAAQRIAGVKSLAGALEISVPEPGMRTDDDIRRECEHALGMTVPGANHAIEVMVSSGWVTLSGTVSWGYERWAVEEIVSTLMGVNGVNGQITVRPLVVHEDVRANINAALCAYPALQASEIDIKVERNRVTLSGRIHSLAQRRAATNASRSTQGVKNVIDQTILVSEVAKI